MDLKFKWLHNKIQKNLASERKKDSYIFCFQDVLSHQMLRRIRWINPDNVFVFSFSSSSVDDRDFTVLPFGLTQIGHTLTEIVNKYKSRTGSCDVFFVDLTVLINLFGGSQVYSTLLNKLGSLREKGIELYAFIYPEAHSDQSILPLFASISDTVIQI